MSEAAFEDVAVVVPVVPVFEEVVAAVLLAFESVLLSDLESVLESSFLLFESVPEVAGATGTALAAHIQPSFVEPSSNFCASAFTVPD